MTSRSPSPWERRPGEGEYAPFYAGYVERVPDGDIRETMRMQMADTQALIGGPLAALADHAYAPGKWTVKEVVGHLCDAERVFSYRMLRFARGDQTALPGFDENAYVATGAFGARPLDHLLEELSLLRQGTLALLEGLPASAWRCEGEASGALVTVAALAWITAGHELHHGHVLRTRYLDSDLPPEVA